MHIGIEDVWSCGCTLMFHPHNVHTSNTGFIKYSRGESSDNNYLNNVIMNSSMRPCMCGNYSLLQHI